jgi:malonyl-CoA O-methyltransferase
LSAQARAVIDEVAVRAIHRRLRRNAQGLDVGWLARQIAARLDERLSIIKLQPQQVLDASGWLGQGAAVLSRRYPAATVSVLERDNDALMHEPTSAPQTWSSRWARWAGWKPGGGARPAAQATIAPGQPWPEVDLVWSNLDLHTHADAEAEIARWHAAVKPGGFVMFSALGPGSFAELQRWHHELGFGPATVPFVDMHDHGDMLVQAGFADPVMDQERLSFTWSDPAAALRDLRALGGNAHPARFAGLRTPRWRQRLSEAWHAHAGSDGRLSLSVEVAYGHAFRVERASRVPAEARITVDELRATARSGIQPGGSGGGSVR